MADQERLVVKPYNPRRERQRLMLAIGLMVACLFIGLLLGSQWFGGEMDTKRSLDQAHHQLLQNQDTLQRRLAIAELNSQVDREALEAVRLELSSLQGELASNTEELGFYRNLLQQEGATSGVMISGLTLTAGADGKIDYRLVLQQRAGKLKNIKVTTTLEVSGLQGDTEHKLVLSEVDPEQDEYYMYLRFRYFYVHDGVMTLPEGFVPARVTVKVWPAGHRKKAITRQFEWQLEEV